MTDESLVQPPQSPQPSTSGLPPAASFDPAHPPSIRLEVEAGAESSLDDAWDRIRDTPHPGPSDWAALIQAERLSRMAWLAAEDSGLHRRKKNGLAELMEGPAQTKAPRKRKADGDATATDGQKATPKRRSRKSKMAAAVEDAVAPPGGAAAAASGESPASQ